VEAATFSSSCSRVESASNSLLVYSANDHVIYVYQGATNGNSHMQCRYKFVISRAGQTVDRMPCDMGSLTR
jgi:hypothetical protein